MYKNRNVYNIIRSKFQDKLSSLLKTAENLKVKGLAEVNILIIMIIMIMILIGMIIKLT